MKNAFFEKFEANVAAGLDRPEAMRKAKADDPDGYESWLAEYNAQHSTATAPERHTK